MVFPLFERRHQKLASRSIFWRRFRTFATIAVGAMLVWVGIGTVVFHATLEHASWVDAFQHASLLASGMGPVPDLHEASNAGKLAEAAYALVSGFVLLAAAGVVAAPIVHRVFHHFHVDDGER